MNPQQIPPTPTPIPTLAPSEWAIQLPEISLWDYTDYPIQYWMMASDAMTILQLIIFIVLVVMILIRIQRKWRAYQDGGEV
jgi:uncharacterized membrane protein